MMVAFRLIRKCVLPAMALLLAQVEGIHAQTPRGFATTSRSAETNAQPRLPPGREEIDAKSAQLETELQGVRAAQTNPLPREATLDEGSEHERLYYQWVVALDSHSRGLRRLEEIRELNEERAAEARNWRGFNETPAYPVVERLLDEIAAQRLKGESHQIILSISTTRISRGAALLEDARRSLRLVQDQIDNLSIPDLRHSWLLRLAQIRVQAHQAFIEASEFERLVAIEGLNGQRDHIVFLTRKLETAQGQTRLTKAVFDESLARLREIREGLQKELIAAIAADADWQHALAVARDQLLQAQTTATPAAQLDELRITLDAAKARSETSDLKVDQLRSMVFLSDYVHILWQDRFWLTDERTLRELRRKRDFHSERLGGLGPWKDFVSQNLAAASSQALSQSFRATEANLTATERKLATEIQAALEERALLYQRAAAAIALAESAAQRFMTELAAKESHMSFGGKLSFAADETSSFVKRIWNTELYVAEDSVVSDGRKISVARSITIGKVTIALLIFITGLAVTGIGRRITRRSMRWFKLDERTVALAAQTVGTVLALTGLFVAMAAVRIPWTVFAFVGGALAIGVGFGAQTLINNFISGLILLFERSIRVGDIVEVDEQRGKIVHIGIRNSLIQRGDGVEILVPNSRFLEKNVVNWTLTDTRVRYSITVGVAYGSPTAKVAALLAQVAAEHERVLKSPTPEVLFEEFGDNALHFSLKFWMRLTENVNGGFVRSELRHRIHALFEQSGIALAFPQRDVHLDATRPLEIRVVNSERTGAEDSKGE